MNRDEPLETLILELEPGALYKDGEVQERIRHYVETGELPELAPKIEPKPILHVAYWERAGTITERRILELLKEDDELSPGDVFQEPEEGEKPYSSPFDNLHVNPGFSRGIWFGDHWPELLKGCPEDRIAPENIASRYLKAIMGEPKQNHWACGCKALVPVKGAEGLLDVEPCIRHAPALRETHPRWASGVIEVGD